MQKIAILYICTGKYACFWEKFYTSFEMFFIPEMHKEYFVFTDNMDLSHEPNVHLCYKECEGFPKDSLFKFDMFLRVKETIQKFDYILFYNSNAQCLATIHASEILPSGDTELFGGCWPGKTKPLNIPMFYPYERNKKSTAFIARKGRDFHYYMGGVNGGTASAYLKMIETLAENIRIDYSHGLVARVHDESHVNRYFRDHKPKILTREYAWPEEWPHDFTPKIILRDKVKIDPSFDKGRKHSITAKIIKLVKALAHAAKWYL